MIAARRGHSLVELLVAMPLALLLLGTVAVGVVAQARLTRALTERAARVEADRIAAGVLAAELRWIAPGEVSAGEDSVRLRVLRGVAAPCGPDPLQVRWNGVRAPAPMKDSVIVVDGRGERVLALSAAQTDAACNGYRLTLEGSGAGGIMLLFETGTYYLRDRALRFRAGGEGRQPLTEEWFEDAETRFLHSPAGAVSGARLAQQARGVTRQTAAREVHWTLPNALER